MSEEEGISLKEYVQEQFEDFKTILTMIVSETNKNTVRSTKNELRLKILTAIGAFISTTGIGLIIKTIF